MDQHKYQHKVPTMSPRRGFAMDSESVHGKAVLGTHAASCSPLPVRVERGQGRGESNSDDSTPRFHQKIEGTAEPEFDNNPDCLRQFNAFPGTPVFKRIDAQLCAFEAPFTVMADFKPPCPCKQLEYRQFIRGHITRDPDGAAEDRGDLLSRLPLGRLWETYQEDGDTSTSPQQYGYRSNPPVDKETLVDRYLDAKRNPDQANGCSYECVDTPWARFNARAGEVWDIQLDFHGDILRDGKPIQRRFWTPIKGRFTAP
jgi:hypothetical protein